MISELARRGLTAMPRTRPAKKQEELFGFRPFPSRGGVVTSEMVNRLGDEEAG